MNVVQVRLLEDKNAKRYTYQVPNWIKLLKGDVVRTSNVNGKECIAICVTDSENLSQNAIDMIMNGNEVASIIIIGRYTFNSFEEDVEPMKNIEILRKLPIEKIAKLMTIEDSDYESYPYSYFNKLDGTLSDNYYTYDDAVNGCIEYLNSEYEEEMIE